ncbi:sensor histidine kinase [Glycomyces sp. NPDC048151]|uniref:sensor histidine kinase n=1 Tax=Glycomyces sp. NPDC048151 TaxID=3364002 RepID=UPI00371CB016
MRIELRWSTLPPLAIDAAVALAVLAAHTAPFLLSTRVADPAAGWTLPQYLPVLALAAPLLWRRQAPFTVLAAVLAAQFAYTMFDPDIAPQEVPYAVLVGTYTAAAYGSRRSRAWSAALLGAAGAVQLLGVLLRTPSGETVARGLILMATAWILGRLTANRKALAERLRAEKEAEARQAAAAERALIARDMHDILGHAISLMVVQAEAGPVVVRTDPDRAEAAFDAIAESGRGAMSQVRTLLGLWEDRDRSDTAPPSIASIADLVAGADRTGTDVTLTETGDPVPLTPDAEVSAYRVVQESLTNVLKHADASKAAVNLDWEPNRLVITVADDGAGRPATESAGRGLIGIRERARACGGTADFGPGPGGRGFLVTVRLPRSRT